MNPNRRIDSDYAFSSHGWQNQNRHRKLNNDQMIFLVPADCRFEMRISSLACAGKSGASCKAGGGVGLEGWRTQSLINVETQSANNSRKCHVLASRGRSRSRLGYL